MRVAFIAFAAELRRRRGAGTDAGDRWPVNNRGSPAVAIRLQPFREESHQKG
jgi:hypothetical protein